MKSGSLTTYEEFEVTVLYDFTPAYDGGRDEPSYAASVEITDVLLNTSEGKDMVSIFNCMTKNQLDRLEEEALEQHEDSDGPEYEREPDEQQEWQDFNPDC